MGQSTCVPCLCTTDESPALTQCCPTLRPVLPIPHSRPYAAPRRHARPCHHARSQLWHFYLLRSVGKGAFGKVSLVAPLLANPDLEGRRRTSVAAALARPCNPPARAADLRSLRLRLLQVRVVQHKKTKELYALKYINKARISKQRAVNNVSLPLAQSPPTPAKDCS